MPPTNPKHKSVPGSELPPPSQQVKKGPPGSIPPRKYVRLSLPMPKSGSSRGHLPAQFPSAIVPVPKPANITASGLAVQGHRLQVTIAGTSTSAPQAVLNFYLRQLGSRGFGEAASPTLGDAQAAQFTRDSDALVVTVRPDGKHGTSFSVAGVLTATQ
jgi:hypothetical protein